jgi:predicted Zn-dependent protease
VIARAALAAVAVLLIGWLAVMEVDARRQADGVKAAQARDFDAADADFRAARALNPDTTPDVNRAFLLQAAGRRDQAVALMRDVLRREPDNLNAWGVLFQFTRAHDPATADRARAARRRLDPVSARGG